MAASRRMSMARLDVGRAPTRANGVLPPPSYGMSARPAALGGTSPRIERPRVMMYSHDGIGLGHMRRNANIATQFVRRLPDASVLMVGSAPTGLLFRVPPGVDFLKLPSIVKVGTNHWEPRSLRVGSNELCNLRAHLIQSAAERYEPHLMIVDHLPAGVWGELLPTLEMLRRMPNPPRVILGLRDILDAPEVVRAVWRSERVHDLIEDSYDRVLIYGASAVYDAVAQYQLDLPGKVHYCGYICTDHACQEPEQVRAALNVTARRLVLVSAGGGADGYPMMEACAKALRELGGDDGLEAILVSGPIMPEWQRRRLEELARGHPIRVLDAVADSLSLTNAADFVIAMGGYNTVVEAVSLGRKTLVIPRAGPSTEQRTRAALLAKMGLIRELDLADAVPLRLAAMIRDGLTDRSAVPAMLRFDGARTAVGHMKRELAAWHAASICLKRGGSVRRASV
jgi:predicted glycosyltransferase